VDFAPAPSTADLRSELTAFLARHLTDDVLERVRATGTVHDWGFHRALAAEGWLAAPWPVDQGGRDLGPVEMLGVLDLLAGAGAPVDGWIVTMNVASTLKAVASAELVAEVLPSVLAGEALVCLGLTEPDAGSDVSSVSTRAVRGGNDWLIDGQKMFTTLAHEARWVFLLTRTDPDTIKHRGLTMFLVPMDSAGIDIQPVHTLGGERTNITFYAGVRVPDRFRVGAAGNGWAVLMTALALERGGEFGGMSQFTGLLARLLDDTADWAHEPDAYGRVPFDDMAVRTRLGRVAAELHVSRLLSARSAWVAGRGRSPVTEAAMAKLHAAETLQRSAGRLLDLVGPAGLVVPGPLEHAYRHAAVTTIYGGSSEILRGIVAGQALRLPASKERA
jgi:alkylation response protein AidB-like acyl-CoA dehydrogenase